MSERESPDGLVYSLVLDGSGKAVEQDCNRVASWKPQDGCLWLHFDFLEKEARNWITTQSGLDDLAVAALLTDETRPRVLCRGNEVLLALRGINLKPGASPDDMISVRIWSDGKRVISTQRRSLLSTEDLLNALDQGNGPKDASDLIVSWIERIIWRMSDTVNDFEDEASRLEESLLSEEVSGLRPEMARLRKQTIGIRRYLGPQREALNRLLNEKVQWLDELDRLRLREAADKLIRHIEDIDTVRERVAMAQEELTSRIAEEMNQRTYVLTVVAAIFLPLGFFTGLMGINVGGMPGIEDKDAFWVVVAICLAVMAVLALVFRLKRWL
jgi:zinc transporter